MKNSVCQPSDSVVNTGTLNVQGANTTTVYTNPSAPIYFLIGNAGICHRRCPFGDCKHIPQCCNVAAPFAMGVHEAPCAAPKSFACCSRECQSSSSRYTPQEAWHAQCMYDQCNLTPQQGVTSL